MDDTFEIKDGEINVEEIMKTIKENIAKRKAEGAYSKEDERLLASNRAVRPAMSGPGSDYDYLNNNWNIENNGFSISSHRKVLGPALVKGRQIINGEVRRYVDASISKQKEYNLRAARTLTAIETDLGSLHQGLENQEDWIGSIKTSADETNEKIDGKFSEIDRVVKNLAISVDLDIKTKASLVELLSRRRDQADAPGSGPDLPINYVVFEDRFRGSSQVITERQSEFIKYFTGCKNLLDIGCGRGEFLELARNNGIRATGIDLNQDMVDYCRSKGLDVRKTDAMEYLKSLDDNSIDGVLMDQVVEHLESDYLVSLLKLCHDKMTAGGHILIETVNPLCVIALANFYIDMTHKRPIHPETLRFLMEYAGFKDNNFLFLSAFGDDTRLKKIGIEPGGSERENNMIAVYNNNIDKLNDIIYGPQDYLVVSRK